RVKSFTPRQRAIKSSTGSAPIERIVPCRSGGISGSASLTAIWLKPQLRHSISIKAMAPALSERSASGGPPDETRNVSEVMNPRASRLVLSLSVLAVRADAGDFDDR